MCGVSSSMANFCCSIELEPRTLRQGQLTQAREVAVDIIQKKETKEATRAFVQGLRPVSSIKEMVMMVQEFETLNIDQDVTKEKVISNIAQTTCQCSSANSEIVDSPDQISQPNKQPLSAPF